MLIIRTTVSRMRFGQSYNKIARDFWSLATLTLPGSLPEMDLQTYLFSSPRSMQNRLPRTRVRPFKSTHSFYHLRDKRRLNRKGKHKLLRENLKLIRITYLGTIRHFVKLVFTNLRLFACGKIRQHQTSKENTEDIKELEKPCVWRNNNLHLIKQLATHPNHLLKSCRYS